MIYDRKKQRLPVLQKKVVDDDVFLG